MSRQTEVSNAHVYTMRDLNQHTADVIREINESGEPAVITRHGRFVALIKPLVGVNVESTVLGAVIAGIENKGQLTGEHTLDKVLTADEVVAELGIKGISGQPPRDLDPQQTSLTGSQDDYVLHSASILDLTIEPNLHEAIAGLSAEQAELVAWARRHAPFEAVLELVAKLQAGEKLSDD